MAWSAGAGAAPSVAVLDFAGRGVSRAFADSVAERLRLEMAGTGSFRLPTELDANRSDEGPDLCLRWDCALRLGRERHVQRVVIGSVETRTGSLVLTTRMVDVERRLPLGKIVFRTDRGPVDLWNRGTTRIAEAFAFEEMRLDSARSGLGSAAVAARADRIRKEQLEAKLQPWAITAGSTFVAADVLLAIGYFLEMRRAIRCTADILRFSAPEGGAGQESSCSESHLIPNAWVGSGLALGGIALVSGAMTIHYGLQLRALARKPTVELSFRPSMDPISGALGLATRLEF